MINAVETIFKNKKVNNDKLIDFGFIKENNQYVYHKFFFENEFELVVEINENGDVSTKIIDKATEELYTLHLVDGASGNFVGKVRSEYESVLQEISNKCFDSDIFKTSQSKDVIKYISEKYGDELEFLWEKFPDTAIWRRKDNKKWYGVLMTIPKSKLGIDSEEVVEIIDLRVLPNEATQLIDNASIFPGYHMNKKRWLTIIFDNGVSTEDIISLVNKSYNLAQK